MIKFLSICILTLSVILSCSKPKTISEIAKSNIESHFLKNANDPSSYEFVELTKIDTVLKKEQYKSEVKYYQTKIDEFSDYPQQIAKLENVIDFYESSKPKQKDKIIEAKELIEKIHQNIKTNTKKLSEYEDLVKSTNGNSIYHLTTTFKCRAKNKLGAKILKTYKVVLNDSLKVLSMN